MSATDQGVRCDECGRFFRYDEPGASTLFVPSTPFTYEECVDQCARCTRKHGPPLSRQNVRRDRTTFVAPTNETRDAPDSTETPR